MEIICYHGFAFCNNLKIYNNYMNIIKRYAFLDDLKQKNVICVISNVLYLIPTNI